jgi:hypothetical protein
VTPAEHELCSMQLLNAHTRVLMFSGRTGENSDLHCGAVNPSTGSSLKQSSVCVSIRGVIRFESR